MKQQQSNVLLWSVIGLLVFLAMGGLRLVGTVIAVLFDILPLLVLGYVFYFVYNTSQRRGGFQNPLGKGEDVHRRFVELLVYIMVQMGKADGQLTSTETRVIYGFFQSQMRYVEIDLKWIAELIETANHREMSLETLCAEFNQHFPYEAKLLLLELIGQIISADGRLDSTEKNKAEHVLALLQIQEKDAYRFRQLYLSSARQQTPEHSKHLHYATLGLQDGATQDEIKKAYREACKRHHPDKVHHLGPEFRRVAEEKMQQINAAYKALSKAA
jgi:DnaJ like chaperone protein